MKGTSAQRLLGGKTQILYACARLVTGLMHDICNMKTALVTGIPQALCMIYAT